MTTLLSTKASITRLTLIILLLALIVSLVSCSLGLRHVQKGLATDPSWQEAPYQQVDVPKPEAELEENIPKKEVR